MADVKLRSFQFVDPKLSDEERAAIESALNKHMIGAEQALKGEGRAEMVNRFIGLLNSLNPVRVEMLESEIKELHSMDKFHRFRAQLILLCLDVFQGGMHFALFDKRGAENQWDIVKILGLDKPPFAGGEK
jgi:hypothetical protein